MTERFTGPFRSGESTGKPIGGNVADSPFAQALYSLACSRGYESQVSLGRAMGWGGQGRVGAWYTGI